MGHLLSEDNAGDKDGKFCHYYVTIILLYIQLYSFYNKEEEKIIFYVNEIPKAKKKFQKIVAKLN